MPRREAILNRLSPDCTVKKADPDGGNALEGLDVVVAGGFAVLDVVVPEPFGGICNNCPSASVSASERLFRLRTAWIQSMRSCSLIPLASAIEKSVSPIFTL